MTLNDMFDHIYCINLDSRTDRWEESLAEFEKHGIKNVERVSAITADDARAMYPNLSIKAGEAGLILSHIKILEDANKNNYESILILEDDVQFAETINDDLREIPDNWEIIYFGGNHAWGQPSKINDKIAIANRTLAMHCLGIKRKAWQKMLSKINLTVPVDVTYANNVYLHNTYVFVPSQAWQRPSYSDLMGHYTDYGFLK